MDISQQIVPFEALISVPISLILASWPTLEPAEHKDESLLSRQNKLLDMASSLTSAQQTEPVRAAILAGDAHALGALAKIDEIFREACPRLLERCQAASLKGAWEAVRHNADLAAGLAQACGMRLYLARACADLAIARRQLRDNSGAIEAFEWALRASAAQGDEAFVADVHERAGDALFDAFRFDEALQHYETAETLEPQTIDKRRVLLKRASVLTALGEYRSAARMLSSQVAQMKASGIRGVELAVGLDTAAQAVVGTGEFAIAIDMLKEASRLFPADALKDLAINSLIHAGVLSESRDSGGAAQAFVQAHELALTLARGEIDAERYRNGFQGALASSVPRDDEAVRLFNEGVAAKLNEQHGVAFEKWQLAANRAYKLKDTQLRLRIAANVAALYHDLGMVDRSKEVADNVSREAREGGLARPEFMALTTLGSLASSGADIRETIGPLGLFTRAGALLEMHMGMLADFNLSPDVLRFEANDTGAIDNELALLSQQYFSNELAARYFRRAIEKARACNSGTLLINRLCGLRDVLDQDGDVEGARAAADEIRKLIKSGGIHTRGLIAGHRALAGQDARSDRPSAISHLREACELMKTFRRTIPLGPTRSDFDRGFHDIPAWLAEFLRQDGHTEEAFDALQLGKGRRVIDALAAKDPSPDQARDEALTAEEARDLLARAGANTFLADLAVEKDGVTAYVVKGAKLRVVHVVGDPSELDRVDRGDVEEREARMVSLCLNSGLLRDFAQAVAAEVPAGSSLMIVTDKFLHNLPLHAIPVEGRSWAEQMPITYAPTAAILRFEPFAAPDRLSLVAGDSRGDLKGAAEECVMVGKALASKPLIGQACTRSAIEKALREGRPDIVHLAVHGRGDARFGRRSSILLADGKGGVEWLDFEELTQFPWSARLVVFSGCSTGVLGLRHGTQLLSVANAALEAGASTVIASLWPVDDEYAKLFMEVFYGALSHETSSGPLDLRRLLEEARHSVQKQVNSAAKAGRRDGRHLGVIPGQLRAIKEPKVEEALLWAPFCLFGAPMFAR